MKRSFHRLLLAGLLLALVAAGCAAAPRAARDAVANKGYGVTTAESSAAYPPAPAAAPMPQATMPAAGRGFDAADEASAEERKIILTANLQLVVQDMQQTVAIIKDTVVGRGGFVSSSNIWEQGNTLRASMTVRVPAAQMESFLDEVKKMAVHVEREQTGGQDVTEEYVDLEAQLRNLEATETELRELLTTVREKTESAEDVMAVYRELTRVRGEIERYKGRMQYLDRMTALATVELQLSERTAEIIGQPGWQPMQTVRRALNGLVEAAKFGVDALIWIVILVVPLLAVPAFVIWLLVRLLKRRSEKKKAEKLSSPESLT
jgi:hypothetical protein